MIPTAVAAVVIVVESLMSAAGAGPPGPARETEVEDVNGPVGARLRGVNYFCRSQI
jgi:hypothetical protein